jgi:hypothetical protein
MESKKMTDLTVEELMEKEQKLKKGKTFHAFFIGLLAGVFIYSMVMKGFKWPSIFPLVLIAIFEKNRRDEQKSLQAEIESRRVQ